jgi:3-hydroxyisobutyrate dehydrogenase-like beta-hydroxyacid dehydrogenase
MSREASSVTVIGLGPMGRAMVESLRASGVEVTVWNRSPEKAHAMREFGAAHAQTVAQALESAEEIVVSLTDYWLRALSDSERTGVPISTFQLLRGSS